MSHSALTRLAAAVWLAIAAFLLYKGIFLLEKALPSGGSSFFQILSHWVGGAEVAASFLLAAGTLLGVLKGRYLLSRAAKRIRRRIIALPTPAPLWRLFSLREVLILLLMMSLGMAMRALHTPPEVRASLLVAVSTALTIGGLSLLKRGPVIN